MRFTREQIDRMEQRGNISQTDAEFLRGGDRNKYKVAPKAERTYNGRVYASKSEMHRAMELDVMVKSGTITYRHQPRYELGNRHCKYVADFEVTDGARTWSEDVKGMPTAKFKRDVRLWRDYGPHPLIILKRKGNGWDREVIKGGAA